MADVYTPGQSRIDRRAWLAAVFAIVFATLAFLRPVDHDESQYVAAAVLTAHGYLPYRDFAYLQTPLQPFAFAPVAALAGAWTWPALRLVNALLGAVAAIAVARAARLSGASDRAALVAAGLFGTCDILLFSIGTARNDALPAALLAGALVAIVGTPSRRSAVVAGLLLAGAAAAKISYALPALAYGLWMLWHRPRHVPWVLLGALPAALFVVWNFSTDPEGFLFGTLHFPARAPAEFYAGRPWKLSLAAKGVDTLKFLALGAALPALVLVARDAWAKRRATLLDWLIVAGLVAALLPEPTWRQYLLPALPPLFVRLALVPPPTRRWRITVAVFAAAGLAPSVAALAGGGLSLAQAMHESAAIRRAFDTQGIAGPIATLSPQFLPATGRLPDPDFATGPFYFRSTGLLDLAAERRLHLMSRVRPRLTGRTILIGGEGPATSGDASLDAALATGGTAVPGTRFRIVRR